MIVRGARVRVTAGPWRGHVAFVEDSWSTLLDGEKLVRVRYVNPSPADVTHGTFNEKHLERF
jgi:hypothetical protein